VNAAAGTLFMSSSMPADSFPADMIRLGVTRVNVKGNPPGLSPSATVDYELDNIKLYGTVNLPTVYSQDFTSDPGMTTDNPAKLHWDSTTKTFHGTAVNTEGSYAYVDLPNFNPNKAWRLEWDHRINSADWSSGFTFGLLDSRLSYPFGAGLDMSIADSGAGTGVWGNGSAVPETFSPAWATGTWYHSTLEFDPSTHQLSLSIVNVAAGTLFMSSSMPADSFPADMTRLGVTRVNVKGNPPGLSPSATVDYELDNIKLYSAAPLGSIDIKMYAGISVNAPNGAKYRIEYSTDLGGTWSTLTTVTVTNGSVLFFDSGSASRARTFYRAVPVF
jgi:hypothetical protein